MERYYTPKGVDVTERIHAGLTILSHTKQSAQVIADRKRSYVYPVIRETIKEFERVEEIFYGVPR